MNDDIFSVPELAEVSGYLDILIVHATNVNKTTEIAKIVLPCSAFAEINGTFVNFEGRVQRVFPAVSTLERERTMDFYQLSRLDKFGSHFDRWNTTNKRDTRPSWKLITKLSRLFGVKWDYSVAEDVFNEIAAEILAFEGLSYEVLSNKGALLKSK